VTRHVYFAITHISRMLTIIRSRKQFFTPDMSGFVPSLWVVLLVVFDGMCLQAALAICQDL